MVYEEVTIVKKLEDNVHVKTSNRHIAQMAYNSSMWYKAVFLQAQRFCRAENTGLEDPFCFPWNEYNSVPLPVERFFLIVAIDHALGNIKALETALKNRGDTRLKSIKEKILDEKGFYQKIRQIRNANEHDIEYSLGIGKKQGAFNNTIPTELGRIPTTAHLTVHVGNKVFLGDADLVASLEHMRAYRDELFSVLEGILCEYY